MNHSRSRMLIFAGLAIVVVLLAILGAAWLIWGWSPFEVKGFSWN